MAMTEHASLFRAAANQIDALDAEIARLNEDKKAVYGNLKDTVPPADFRAWRDAVKIRRKSAADRDKADAHDARVFAILHDIEASGTPVATRAPAGAREAEPSTGAGEPSPAAEGADAGEEGVTAVSPSSPDVPHDPITGEITEPSPAESTPASDDEEGGDSPPVDPPSEPDWGIVGEKSDNGAIVYLEQRYEPPPAPPDITLPAFLRRKTTAALT